MVFSTFSCAIIHVHSENWPRFLLSSYDHIGAPSSPAFPFFGLGVSTVAASVFDAVPSSGAVANSPNGSPCSVFFDHEKHDLCCTRIL